MRRLLLGASAEASLLALRSSRAPAALVVEEEELPALRRLDRLLVDRGRKHPAKPLRRKLLGQERIPLLAGSFRSHGQLVRSVRTLLTHALKSGERNLYVLGVDALLFAQLWQRAEEEAPTGEAQTLAAVDSANSTLPAPARASLHALLAPLPVPESLVRQYVGRSSATALLRQLVVRAARHDEPVLVLGDTGTGKEVVARLIHEHGPRRRFPFTPVNCGAIPSELLESELFGQEPGSHSTATARTLGLWRAAGQGTLFLDEIADLALAHQVKILRALEQRRIRPVGGTREIGVRARVVAATNRDLFGLVRQGRFREDLYYRLRSFLIRTRPLREHPEDVAPLADHFWRRITRDPERSLPPELLVELARHRWPGNARELKMVLSSLHSLFGDRELSREHLHAVMDYEGHGEDDWPQEIAESSRHRIDCLRHLRRVDETLRACQVALKPRRDGDAAAEEANRILIERVSELGELGGNALLFHSAALYELVRRLTERLAELLLDAKPTSRAARARAKKLDQEFALVSSALFEEVAELEREG